LSEGNHATPYVPQRDRDIKNNLVVFYTGGIFKEKGGAIVDLALLITTIQIVTITSIKNLICIAVK
jgi:hypothetical protein